MFPTSPMISFFSPFPSLPTFLLSFLLYFPFHLPSTVCLPSAFRIERAVLELKQLEALTTHVSRDGDSIGYDATELTADDLDEAFDGDLTFVGLVMSDIPLDVHLTKLILMGYEYTQ